MNFLNSGVEQRYQQWLQEPLTEDDLLNSLICEQNGVKLIEQGVDQFQVEYEDAGRRVKSPMFGYAEAEANFARRVAEVDYR